jgi:hypothetical protein
VPAWRFKSTKVDQFGHDAGVEELDVAQLDSKTGAATVVRDGVSI